jgi:hypothetical protein
VAAKRASTAAAPSACRAWICLESLNFITLSSEFNKTTIEATRA